MAKKKSKKSNNYTNADLKSTTINFSLNILIFLLLGVILYLSYSVFIKLTGNENIELIDKERGMPSEIIQAEVLNGCGVNGIADRFTDFLRANYVDVVKTGNYMQFDMDETIVVDRMGNKANALKVAEVLGVKESKAIQQLNNDYFVDVTIIIGRDYHKLKPIKQE